MSLGDRSLIEKTRPDLRSLLEQKKIRRSKATIDLVVKELDIATGDLEAAQRSLKNGDYKWSTIQAYYSMFHAARALLYRMSYREQNQHGLLAALHQLYEREMVGKMLQDFSEAMTLCERANDSLTIKEDYARTILENSAEFLEEAARILAAPREWFERPAPQRRPKTAKR